MNRLTRPLWLAVWAMCLLLPAVALAWKPDASDFAHLERQGSLNRIPEDAAERIQKMLLPVAMDQEVVPGLVLDGISLERYWVELRLKSQTGVGSVFLLSLDAEAPAKAETPSFKVAVDGQVPEAAVAKLVAVLFKNDREDFWPKDTSELVVGGAQGAAEQQAEQVLTPEDMRLADVSHLWGDLWVSLWILLGVFAARGFWTGFQLLNRWDWLCGAAVLAVAVAWRWAFAAQAEPLPELAWQGEPVLASDFRQWLWYTLGRFAEVTPALCSWVNLGLGAVSAWAVWLAVRLVFQQQGLWPALMAGLFVACWPAHIALSTTPTVFVGLGLLMVLWLLGTSVFIHSGCIWVHLWAVLNAGGALFLRPEAALLMLPFFFAIFLLTERGEWRRLEFWLPQALLAVFVVARLATVGQLELGRDPFLAGDFSLQALTGLLGQWVFSYTLMPFPALLLWAAAIAARPWKGDFRWHYWALAAAFCVAWGTYFHGFGVDGPWASRVSLAFILPLTGIAALGTTFLARTLGKWSSLAMSGLAVVMIAAPVWHFGVMKAQVAAHLVLDFLL